MHPAWLHKEPFLYTGTLSIATEQLHFAILAWNISVESPTLHLIIYASDHPCRA